MKKISEKSLAYRQRLPLEVKIKMVQRRIQSFLDYYGDDVYVSFSGGKDSTVLLYLARSINPNIKALYLDTWMEYPQVRQFVRCFDNVIHIKPKQSMKEIIEDCGWCFPGKDVAEMIEAVRRGQPWAIKKINGLDKDGNPSQYREQYKKWRILVDAPFHFSSFCCIRMKEEPVQDFEKETGMHPLLALMASESSRRKESYLRTGCNTFHSNRPLSKPMGFLVEQDILHFLKSSHDEILQYIKNSNSEEPLKQLLQHPWASVYGDIMEQGQLEGQLSLFDDTVCNPNCLLKTTGETRTGCMFCPVGCHLDKFAKFKRLHTLNPKLYDYCMDELGLRDLCIWIEKNILKNPTNFFFS